MRSLGFGEEVDLVEAGRCPFCKSEVEPDSFKNEISRREYRISGLCQDCQDKTFEPSLCEDCGTEPCRCPDPPTTFKVCEACGSGSSAHIWRDGLCPFCGA